MTKSTKEPPSRAIAAGGGRIVRATPVFDTYWRFAAERQSTFMRRLQGAVPPWSDDPILTAHRFTNAYRASDRVSQYLIRHVIYEGSQDAEEVVFRTLLFKVFNRVSTWERLVNALGEPPAWRTFRSDTYAAILDRAMDQGDRLYSAAYIMPSPAFGHPRKHRNHLALLAHMMRAGVVSQVAGAASLREVFAVLRAYPSLGDFLAFQFAIDLNYSEVLDFSEMDFVVAGPGAREGLRKCFADTGGLSDAELIALVARIAEEEFDRLQLRFQKLGGTRALQLIDCQNLFCETAKYARVAHPEYNGPSGRSRIKQCFSPSAMPLPQFYPAKWSIRVDSSVRASGVRPPRGQMALGFSGENA